LPGNIKITACAEIPSGKYVIGEGKGKGHPITCHEGQRGNNSTFSLTLVLYEGGWSKARPRPLYPQERKPLPILQEAEDAVGPTENIWLLMILRNGS